MFGNVLFLDFQKVNDYKTIIKGEKNLKIEKVRISNDKGIDAKIPIVSGAYKASQNYEASVEESALFECDEFEKLLEGRDDYFDFTKSSDFDIETMQRGYIIKFDGYIDIPEEFDLTQTIAQFKPMLMNSITRNMESDEQEAFRTFFTSSDINVPIITECNNHLLCAKINSKNLKVEYNQLEECEAIEVTIIARITSSSSIQKSKPIFDPFKDFIRLNRTLRRSMGNERPEGLKEIFVDEDYRNIEILAIYQ